MLGSGETLSIGNRVDNIGWNWSVYREIAEISRDFVFIDDAVDALIKSGQLEIENGFTVDIGSGKAERILEIARMLAERLGVKNEAFQITGEFRAGDIRHACADISVAETVLGWKPQTSIPNGLNKLAEWAKNNNDHKR